MSRGSTGDDGLAVVEVLVVLLLFAVPIAYAAAGLLRVHTAATTAQTSAAAAALAVARGTVPAEAADRVAVSYWRAPGIAAVEPHVSVACRPRPCVQPDGTVEVTVEVHVELPGLPWRVPVRARQSHVVDRFAVGS